MNSKEIGSRIKRRRKELKFTLQEIADMVGVASSTIQRYESGSISQYKLPVLESIAKAINVNPTWLVKEDAPMTTGISDDIFIKENKMINKQLDSTHFILKPNSENLSKEELFLLDNFNKLNSTGKKEANKRVAELTEINKYINIIETNKNEYLGAAAHNDFANDKEQQKLMKEDLDEL